MKLSKLKEWDKELDQKINYKVVQEGNLKILLGQGEFIIINDKEDIQGVISLDYKNNLVYLDANEYINDVKEYAEAEGISLC